MIGWARRLDPSWQIRLVDMVPGSPRHFSRFVDAEMLPLVLVENKFDKQTPNRAEHASDMVRLPLLYTHGGIYLDV